ncbi:hypothetical protein EO98_02065 [Methanosarcina sp. 2.H.T.1A.6]|uniref:hypothetical protein n=1 Tax=unclassified Methanosarcina TaxID=2644672 RepID=UPI000622AB35|nr:MULTISPECIES: hypothetical protein [unclassified Methanosarcina]KKG17215.1 hypothetical protein EO97_09705 [Methanosarcina sp. 2.H.T.1A.15]KKG17326.1 hypothetical protein EO94_17680 [Methanosarcina sp. 2.H.T.1A.3]KKG20525.1 hypothetical protein EO98_02065 [Methanosarcina sp. 2.H.T.1A.6]KKG21376.1 hypothetical protein EO96_03245 [Methanosarcina sp. 2.H.T.1A.8]
MITINETFRTFLSEQEACLKPDTFMDCEDVILLYEEFLELSAEDYLSEEDMALCAARPERENKNYFDVFGLEHLSPAGIKDFLDDYVVEVGGGKKFIGTAAKVLQSFFEWAREKGYIEEKAFEANREVLAKYKKRY